MKYTMFFIITLIVMTSVCDTISQLFLKSSINSLDLHINSIKKIFGLFFKLIRIPRVWIGFIFSGLSLSIWLFILTKADLNLAFSLDSMHYIFIALGSMLVLKEKIGAMRWLGIVAIMSGILLVSIS